MTFSEVIRVCDGVPQNLAGHQARMNRTMRHFFGRGLELQLPVTALKGLVKCRVVYGAGGIESVEFSPYTPRRIDSVKIVRDDDIEYTYKSTDRSRLNALREASGCDEIIIVKRGLVTDTSFANIVIEDASGALITPSTPLLAGTKREMLLREGVITEREINPEELCGAAKIYIINAMLDIGACLTLPTLVLSQPFCPISHLKFSTMEPHCTSLGAKN